MNFGHSSRTIRETAIDKLLLLYILSKYKIDGKTKLQKAIFFAEKSTNEKGVKIFNFDFIRYNFGEYSNELQTDYRELYHNGFILDTRPIEITDESKELLKRCQHILGRNGILLNKIEPIIEHIVSLPLDRIKEMAYTKIVLFGKEVKDLEIGTPILYKLNSSQVKSEIIIDDKWIEKLNSFFSLGVDLLDEDTKKEYSEIQNLMKPTKQLRKEDYLKN